MNAFYFFVGLISVLAVANIVKVYGVTNEQLLNERSIDDQIKALGIEIDHSMDQCGDKYQSSDYCKGIVDMIDNFCQNMYFNGCWGSKWSEYVDENGEIDSPKED